MTATGDASHLLAALLGPERERCWIASPDASQNELVAAAQGIAALLGPCVGARVVLSCRRARAFVPGLLGAWLSGAVVDLLPNVQPGTLDRVDADADVVAVLHDVAAASSRSAKAIFVPAVPSVATLGAVAAWPAAAVRMTTSGTTGQPKYITKSLAQLWAELEILASVFAPARRLFSTVPLSHLYGLLFGALLPLRMGATIVDDEALLPVDVAAVIEREAVDLMVSTPLHLRAMAATVMPRGLRVVSSGARLDPALHMALVSGPAWQVTDVLGSTETGGIATRGHPLDDWTPLPGVEVSTRSDGGLTVASPWCDGGRAELDDRIEILVSPKRGFHHLGRSGDVVKIAGKRADAQAIEAAVRALPGVADVALLVHAPSAGTEPRIAMAVSLAGAATVVRSAIVDAVRRQFDAVFVPKTIKLVPVIPRTARGKLAVSELRTLLGLSAAPSTTRIPFERLEPGRYRADVPQELVFFQGHFDSIAILPGAMLVERLVWPIVRHAFPDLHELRGARRLRFRRPILPGQRLSVVVERSHDRVHFEVACMNSLVATGQLLLP